jgi:hypothetical protein
MPEYNIFNTNLLAYYIILHCSTIINLLNTTLIYWHITSHSSQTCLILLQRKNLFNPLHLVHVHNTSFGKIIKILFQLIMNILHIFHFLSTLLMCYLRNSIVTILHPDSAHTNDASA